MHFLSAGDIQIKHDLKVEVTNSRLPLVRDLNFDVQLLFDKFLTLLHIKSDQKGLSSGTLNQFIANCNGRTYVMLFDQEDQFKYCTQLLAKRMDVTFVRLIFAFASNSQMEAGGYSKNAPREEKCKIYPKLI